MRIEDDWNDHEDQQQDEKDLLWFHDQSIGLPTQLDLATKFINSMDDSLKFGYDPSTLSAELEAYLVELFMKFNQETMMVFLQLYEESDYYFKMHLLLATTASPLWQTYLPLAGLLNF